MRTTTTAQSSSGLLLRRRSSSEALKEHDSIAGCWERTSSNETMQLLMAEEEESTIEDVLLCGYEKPDTAVAVSDDSDEQSSSSEPEEGSTIIPKKNQWSSSSNLGKKKAFDVETYMAQRAMTATQERWNAISILPNPIYCLYFILSARWVVVQQPNSNNDHNDNNIVDYYFENNGSSFWNGLLGDAAFDDSGCFKSAAWHSMPAPPPLPVAAVAAGICLHAPFSFLYHWKYAAAAASGNSNNNNNHKNHWSRRADQSMIHVCSALVSYATSGNVVYFLANCLYNADCIVRQFGNRVRPKRNQIRIAISMVLYTLPILQRGELWQFMEIWLVLGISGWLFAAYPVGGWSHCAFHFVVALVPPLLMESACELPASAPQLHLAAHCLATTSQP